MLSPASYDSWTREELIVRLRQLENSRSSSGPSPPSSQSKKDSNKLFDFTSYPTRKIALKFCYSGWAYNGLAFQSGPTPLPTVEDTLFKALAQTRLIDPESGFEGCRWEKCGRTDRGVSAAGQVVSLWVRSALRRDADPVEESQIENASRGMSQYDPPPRDAPIMEDDFSTPVNLSDPPTSTRLSPAQITSSACQSELRYVSVLNRVLPPTIRVVAWSPVSPSFSARFACRQRHYKYFFTPRGLDIALMRQGAERLVGEHDFRNYCKLDPAKQISNFKRRIIRAEINPVSVSAEGKDNVYVFDLVGTAFLYHQVRHIMAILFLVGTGLEPPSVVSELLNVGLERPEGATLEIVDRKPEYQMADGLPLMLWDCVYANSEVQWRTDGEEGPEAKDSTARAGSGAELYRQVHSIHTHSLIHTTLDAHFLSAVARHHSAPVLYFPLPRTGFTLDGDQSSVISIPLGAGTFKRTAKYVPLLKRKRLESVEVTNARWLLRKGGKKEESKGLIDAGDGGDE